MDIKQSLLYRKDISIPLCIQYTAVCSPLLTDALFQFVVVLFSVDRGEPFNFQLGMGQVIKGWDEGLLDMCVGDKRKLTIPSDKAYGKAGAGDVIPAGEWREDGIIYRKTAARQRLLT